MRPCFFMPAGRAASLLSYIHTSKMPAVNVPKQVASVCMIIHSRHFEDLPVTGRERYMSETSYKSSCTLVYSLERWELVVESGRIRWVSGAFLSIYMMRLA
jgi:hypothetical protein